VLARLWDRFFGRRVSWQRSIVQLRDLEALARLGLAGMLLAQEKARLEFTRAREDFERSSSRAARDRVDECLTRLQATNAVVQSLLNEHCLEQRLAAEQSLTAVSVGKSR
jgi:hypothetical protein